MFYVVEARDRTTSGVGALRSYLSVCRVSGCDMEPSVTTRRCVKDACIVDTVHAKVLRETEKDLRERATAQDAGVDPTPREPRERDVLGNRRIYANDFRRVSV